MINFNYHTHLYPCFSNYVGLKIYFLIPKCYFQSLIWNGHMFFHIYTNFHVSHFCIYIIICELCGEKRLQIAQYFLLCSCLINVRTIIVVTIDLVA